MEEESKVYEKSDLAGLVRSEYGESGFKDLSNTKDEVKRIEKTLMNDGFRVKAYLGSKGNAESFVALNGKSPSIVHIHMVSIILQMRRKTMIFLVVIPMQCPCRG